jgi:hypothetical protein
MEIANPVRVSSQPEETVVVRLWEVYLLYHPANLYRTLTDSSLEGASIGDPSLPGRVIFKFSRKTWEESIRDVLYKFRIPVVIESSRLSAVSVKGRQPVLR